MNQITEYIINCRHQKIPDNQIINNLVRAGWQQKDIGPALDFADGVKIKKAINPVSGHRLLIISAIIILVFLLITISLSYNLNQKNNKILYKSSASIRKQINNYQKNEAVVLPTVTTVPPENKKTGTEVSQTAELTNQINNYFVELEVFKKAVLSENISSIAMVFGQYQIADSRLANQFKITQGPIMAYLLSSNTNNNQELSSLTRQFLEIQDQYIQLKSQINLSVALLLLEKQENAKQQLESDFINLKSTVTGYHQLINKINPMLSDYSLSGYIDMLNYKTDPAIPEVNRPVKLKLLFRNVGNDKIDECRIKLEVPEELTIEPKKDYSFTIIKPGEEFTVDIDLIAEQSYNGIISVNITTNSNQNNTLPVIISVK